MNRYILLFIIIISIFLFYKFDSNNKIELQYLDRINIIYFNTIIKRMKNGTN